MAKSKAVTATGLAISGAGSVKGIIVSSHSSGTFKLDDSVGGGQNVLVNTWTLAAGPQVITFPDALDFENGLFVTVGGTLVAQLIV